MATEAEREQAATSDMASLMAAMSDLGVPQYQIRKIGACFGADKSLKQPENDENAIVDATILRLKGSEDNSSGTKNPDADRIVNFGDVENKEIFSSQVVQLGMKVGDKTE